MSWFNFQKPIFCRKQQALDIQDLRGLLRINWKIKDRIIFSSLYTRIDQSLIIWGLVTAAIFATAQFLPFSWYLQSIFWSLLTLIATIIMVVMTWFWATVERLIWVIYCWAFLMLAGLLFTDISLFAGWGSALIYLCPLWLFISALGYFCTGLALHSRAFFLIGTIHLLTIEALPYVGGWQFLVTGGVMTISLLFLAELQWDMRPPIQYSLLTVKEREFNQEQQRLRQNAAELNHIKSA
jgi:hypothetical protein